MQRAVEEIRRGLDKPDRSRELSWFDGVVMRAQADPTDDRYVRLPFTDWEGIVWGWRQGEKMIEKARKALGGD